MKLKKSKLYRYITEGTDPTEDEKMDVVPVEEEDDSELEKDELDEEDVVNDGTTGDGDIETQKKAAKAMTSDTVTEEDETDDEKNELDEEDDSETEKDELDEEESPEDPEDDMENGSIEEEGDASLDTKATPTTSAKTLSPNDKKEVSEEDDSELEKDELDEEDEEDEKLPDFAEETEDEIEKLDVKEDVRALFAGQKLTDAFKKKTKTIFEAAVKKHVKSIVKKLQENYNNNLSKIEKKLSKKLVKDTDKYLNYVVENWLGENKLAVERGIRTEITEEFISSFKTLCEQHNINLPENKYDVADKLARKLETTEKRLNEALNDNIQLSKMLNEGRKQRLIASLSKGLTESQAEKLAKLAAGVVFKNKDQFVESIKTLKESYFQNTVKSGKGEMLVEGGLNKVQTSKTDVDVYSNYIERNTKS